MTRVSDETANDDGFVTRWSRRKVEANDDAGAMPPDESQRVAVPVRGRMITEPIVVARELQELRELEEPGERDEPGKLAVASVSGEQDATGALEQPDASGDGDASANEDALAELETIDIEALDYSADFTRFMQPGVPEALRRRALRRLWRTNPVLANVDGLNDYDEDYRDAALAVDVLKTVHRVGKGYLTDDEVEAYQVAKDEADAGGGDSVSAGAADEDDAVESAVADGPEQPEGDRVEADATIASSDDDADDADVDDDDGDLDYG